MGFTINSKLLAVVEAFSFTDPNKKAKTLTRTSDLESRVMAIAEEIPTAMKEII